MKTRSIKNLSKKNKEQQLSKEQTVRLAGGVHGHTHYDRIEFDCPQGPATPVITANP